MLTIEEIKNVSFRRAKKLGYSAEDVDNFIDNVVATIESYNTEKTEVMKKIDFLAKKLEKYRADEDIVRNALIRSEKVSKDTISEASVKADNIINEANAKAEQIVSAAQAKADEIILKANKATLAQKDELVALEESVTKFREQLIDLYNEQINAVKDMKNILTVKVSKDELDKKYAGIEQQNKTIEQKVKKEPKIEVIIDERPSVKAEDKVISINANKNANADDKVSMDKTQSFSIKNRNLETKTEPKKEVEVIKSKNKKDKKQHKFLNLKFGSDYDFEEQ